jgi:hypothetical protein
MSDESSHQFNSHFCIIGSSSGCGGTSSIAVVVVVGVAVRAG